MTLYDLGEMQGRDREKDGELVLISGIRIYD